MIYKIISITLLALVTVMCSTNQDGIEQVALFIRICNHTGDSCQTYLPTKHNISDPNSFDAKAFIDSNKNVFLGQKDVNYNYLHYIRKDTITILIQHE